MQNSTAVFQLNISNKTRICASISRPNAKPRNVSGHSKRRQYDNKLTVKMKRQMKFIIMWTSILTFFGCGQTNSKNNSDNKVDQANKTEQYVSMDCQTGDITLTLNSDQTFDLTIQFWDSKTNQHTGQESVKGNWVKTDKILTLTTNDNNKIIYELTTTNMKIGDLEINSVTYGFKSNDKDFFATDFGLLEKGQTDEFLINASK